MRIDNTIKYEWTLMIVFMQRLFANFLLESNEFEGNIFRLKIFEPPEERPGGMQGSQF